MLSQTEGEKMKLQTTEAQKVRTARHWGKIAGEYLDIHATTIGEPVYALGSELACRRILAKMTVGRVAYSANLQTWFYVNK